MGVTNSWFTSGQGQQIECIVTIGQINLNVYQGDVLINSNEDNETASSPSYVDLTSGTNNRKILPDQDYTLNLTLRNEETTGTQSIYVRYKIELFACNNGTDILLNPIISGYTTPASSSNGLGFVYNSADGYYYYQNGSGVNQTLPAGANVNIIGSFNIPYSDFAYTGEYSTINGNNIKLVITIEGFDTDPQAA